MYDGFNFVALKYRIKIIGWCMELFKIIKDIRIKKYNPSLDYIDLRDIKTSHKDVKKGDLFIALHGENFNGNDFIKQAFDNGAQAVISDEKNDDERIIYVENARKAYSLACKNFFDRACDNLKIIAVTGTNGKTTVANTTTEMLRYAGAKVGLIGTLGAKVEDEVIDTGFTTPDPYILHKLFKKMEDDKCEYVVMEASAHALALDKLEGIKFEIGVLTNITEDHLDYFKNMENYTKAKMKLFDRERTKLGLICVEDELCKENLLKIQVPFLTYGFNKYSDIKAENIKKSFSGTYFDCDFFNEYMAVKTNLVGEYNILNALAAIGICRSLGVPKELVRIGMSCINPVEGRFNIINMKDNNIVIDYAHTPDGLEKILETAKDLSENKLVVIFGCGGNRDRQKRPIMGEIASRIADDVILTSDNPRFEEPYAIIDEIKSGIKKDCKVIENRKKAIEYALNNYKNGETIVIAGKGAEKYQEIKGVKYPYNDFDVVYKYYRKRIKEISSWQNQNEDEEEKY